MRVKDPKTILRNLFSEYKHKDQNVVYVEKLFIVNTVINYLFKDKSYRELDQFQIARYGELINRFLKEEVDIYWKNGRLMVRDLESGEHYEGG